MGDPADGGGELWRVGGVAALDAVVEYDTVVVVEDLALIAELHRPPEPAFRDRAGVGVMEAHPAGGPVQGCPGQPLTGLGGDPPGRSQQLGQVVHRAVQPAPPPLTEELTALLRRMRLPYLRSAAPEVLATARAQRWDPAETLRVLLAEEVAGRDDATRRQHRRAAGLPAGKTFASWREHDSSIPAPHPTRPGHAGVDRAGGEPRCYRALGRKTHLVEALAHAAIDAGRRVAWFTLESLTAAVGRAGADGSVARTITKITRADLIVVDLCRHRDYAEAQAVSAC